MTLFDLIAAAVIGISALIGFSRGAVRELVGLVAFVVSAAAALFLLPWTGAVARHLVSSPLLTVALAVIVGFAVVYLGFKMLGHMLASRIHQQPFLGGADRSLGLGFGAVRALILLGLFALVFELATPQVLQPRWITGGFLYPLASACGRLLSEFAPKGLQAAARFSPLLKNAAGDDARAGQPSENDGALAPPPPTNHLVISNGAGQKSAATGPVAKSGRTAGQGYTKRTRDSLDAIVEKTR